MGPPALKRALCGTLWHSVAPIFGQNHANARLYMVISSKNRCHKPSWQGLRQKHTLKIPLCIIFYAKKPCSKVQNLQQKFLDWKCPPPPLWNFSENSYVLVWGGFP